LIKQIELKNFQSHKNTLIDFSNGINVLCGESDNGKSAVIRAIRWVYENRPLGSDKLNSYWNEKFKEPMSVKITFDNDKWVERIRSSTVNGYNYFDGEKVVNLEAVGSDVPRVISDFMNMSNVNFQFQFDSPYLLGMTSSEATKYLNEIIHLDSIDKIQSLAASDKKTITSMKKQIANDLESYSKKIKDLSWLDEANDIQKRIEVYDSKLNEISVTLSDVESEITNYKSCLSSVVDLSEQESIIKDIEEIFLEDFSDFENEIQNYKNLMEIGKHCEIEIEKLVSELPDVCPLCGSKIHGGNCV